MENYHVREVDPRILHIVIDQLWGDESGVHAFASLVEDLYADSLDLVEYILALEEEFKIAIPSR